MDAPPAQAVPPAVVAFAINSTFIGPLVMFTKVCTGIVLVPLNIAPVIPAGCVQVQLRLAPTVAELSVTAAEGVPEQMV